MAITKSLYRSIVRLAAPLGLAVSAVLISPVAGATLIGQTIGCSIQVGGSGNVAVPTNPVVGAGPECAIDPSLFPNSVANADFFEESGDTFLDINFGNVGTFLFYDFTDLFWLDDPTAFINGLEFVSGNLSDPDPEVAFDAHSISISLVDFEGIPQSARWRISTTPVPMPGALMGVALLGMYLVRRRKPTLNS
ncbi:MAG: hypothetical protein R3228_10330 [Halioglobus sp.]|nr:hypothetical protein [Halioglobus sp.]